MEEKYEISNAVGQYYFNRLKTKHNGKYVSGKKCFKEILKKYKKS